jgi:hypothetical protein
LRRISRSGATSAANIEDTIVGIEARAGEEHGGEDGEHLVMTRLLRQPVTDFGAVVPVCGLI